MGDYLIESVPCVPLGQCSCGMVDTREPRLPRILPMPDLVIPDLIRRMRLRRRVELGILFHRADSGRQARFVQPNEGGKLVPGVAGGGHFRDGLAGLGAWRRNLRARRARPAVVASSAAGRKQHRQGKRAQEAGQGVGKRGSGSRFHRMFLCVGRGGRLELLRKRAGLARGVELPGSNGRIALLDIRGSTYVAAVAFRPGSRRPGRHG